MKIVALDDSKHFRLLIQSLLTRAGHEVIVLEAWSTLAATIRKEDPDLLLLDLNMPLPGENVGAIIRKFYADLPILFVSGETPERIERAVRSMDAVGFVLKDKEFRTRLPQAVEELGARFANSGYAARPDTPRRRAVPTPGPSPHRPPLQRNGETPATR